MRKNCNCNHINLSQMSIFGGLSTVQRVGGVSMLPLRYPDLENAGDLKFLSEVYSDKRLRLPNFHNG